MLNFAPTIPNNMYYARVKDPTYPEISFIQSAAVSLRWLGPILCTSFVAFIFVSRWKSWEERRLWIVGTSHFCCATLWLLVSMLILLPAYKSSTATANGPWRSPEPIESR